MCMSKLGLCVVLSRISADQLTLNSVVMFLILPRSDSVKVFDHTCRNKPSLLSCSGSCVFVALQVGPGLCRLHSSKLCVRSKPRLYRSTRSSDA